MSWHVHCSRASRKVMLPVTSPDCFGGSDDTGVLFVVFLVGV